MPDPAVAARGADAAHAGEDQAAGLRRLFAQAPSAWSLALLPSPRQGTLAPALARRARTLAASADTLVIDAARALLALPFGLQLRYDLSHALAGDCPLESACVRADDGLWLLPAARAVDMAVADPRAAARAAQAIWALAAPMRQVLVLLPPSRAAWIRQCGPLAALQEATLVIEGRQDPAAAVLTAVRQVMSESEIDTFHLLFPDMGDTAAGRLSSGMAAIAQRYFGATLRSAGAFAPARPARTAPGGGL